MEPVASVLRTRFESPSRLARMAQASHAPWLTHLSLAALLILELLLLVKLPFWQALLPCVVTHHRIGIMLHEYMHGIPLRKYSSNLAVFSLVNGLLLTFGFMEVFRGNHLAHHHWLNTEQDPGWHAEAAAAHTGWTRPFPLLYRSLCGEHGFFMYLGNLIRSLRGRHPYTRRRRILLEIGWSSVCLGIYVATAHAALIWKLFALHFWVAHSAALRGAVEHSSLPGDNGFANEYRVKLPLFNMNRHVHHHIDPTCPWYRLRFVTPRPLSHVHYWTHWYHIFVKRDYAFMQPMTRSNRPSRRPGFTAT